MGEGDGRGAPFYILSRPVKSSVLFVLSGSGPISSVSSVMSVSGPNWQQRLYKSTEPTSICDYRKEIYALRSTEKLKTGDR